MHPYSDIISKQEVLPLNLQAQALVMRPFNSHTDCTVRPLSLTQLISWLWRHLVVKALTTLQHSYWTFSNYHSTFILSEWWGTGCGYNNLRSTHGFIVLIVQKNILLTATQFSWSIMGSSICTRAARWYLWWESIHLSLFCTFLQTHNLWLPLRLCVAFSTNKTV